MPWSMASSIWASSTTAWPCPTSSATAIIEAVRNGVRVVKMDPCTILTCMGMATKNLGLGSTYSTTYYEPFHVARVFATLDLMVGGRAAWNVVTSLNSSEAQNFGEAEHPEHDLRYDKADEFMEVVLGHWDSWEDDAMVVDKDSGLFAHAEKVHKLGHQGRWFRSKGPFTVPRSPQGRPVIIQAGQSGRGRDFAARWGELVFCVYSSVEMGRKQYRAFKDQLAAYGRDPDSVRVCPATYIIAGETQSMAEDKRALIDKMAKPIDALALLSEALNFDFASKPMDQPFTDEELKNISGLRGILDRVVLLSGNKNPSLGDFVKYSKRGTIGEHPVLLRQRQAGRRSARGVVQQLLRRFRLRGHGAAGHLRGYHALRRARAAAPRPASQGLQRADVAR